MNKRKRFKVLSSVLLFIFVGLMVTGSFLFVSSLNVEDVNVTLQEGERDFYFDNSHFSAQDFKGIMIFKDGVFGRFSIVDELDTGLNFEQEATYSQYDGFKVRPWITVQSGDNSFVDLVEDEFVAFGYDGFDIMDLQFRFAERTAMLEEGEVGKLNFKLLGAGGDPDNDADWSGMHTITVYAEGYGHEEDEGDTGDSDDEEYGEEEEGDTGDSDDEEYGEEEDGDAGDGEDESSDDEEYGEEEEGDTGDIDDESYDEEEYGEEEDGDTGDGEDESSDDEEYGEEEDGDTGDIDDESYDEEEYGEEEDGDTGDGEDESPDDEGDVEEEDGDAGDGDYETGDEEEYGEGETGDVGDGDDETGDTGDREDESVLVIEDSQTNMNNESISVIDNKILEKISQSDAKYLEVKMDIADVRISRVDLERLEEDVEIRVRKLEKEDVEKYPENSILLIDVKIFSGGVDIREFIEDLFILVHYEKSPDEDTNVFTVFHLDENGESENIIGVYQENTGTVNFRTKHLSMFFIAPNRVNFNDNNQEWATRFINSMSAKGIIKGYGEGSFKPENNVTRAEFVTMMVNALKLPVAEYRGTFKDVNQTDWFAGMIETGYEHGLISGFGDGIFAPRERITREQMTAIVTNVMEAFVGKEIIEDNGLLKSIFDDYDQISDYARVPVATAYNYDVVRGRGNGFFPREMSMRSEASVVIYKIVNMMHQS